LTVTCVVSVLFVNFTIDEVGSNFRCVLKRNSFLVSFVYLPAVIVVDVVAVFQGCGYCPCQYHNILASLTSRITTQESTFTHVKKKL